MDDVKIIEWNGKLWRKYPNERYYKSHRWYLHREVWKFYNGDIPKGYHIHHIDHDIHNNNISNLELMEASQHRSYHGKIVTQAKLDNLDNIRHMTKAWHSSNEGIQWHIQHGKNVFGKRKEKDYICKVCYKDFKSKKPNEKDIKFCSNNCKSKYRRDSGLDNEQRNCVVCKKLFTINRYSKTKTCSNNCKQDYKKQSK